MNQPTGTQIAYLHLCHRKLWLFANGINMEHSSELVAAGKLLGETTYQKRANKWQELQIENIKIDHYDAVNGIIREVKKSNKRDEAHIAQLKYYLFVLQRNDIEAKKGILEYPKLKETEEVVLTAKDLEQIPQWEQKIREIVQLEECPDKINASLCKRCAYYEFCYS